MKHSIRLFYSTSTSLDQICKLTESNPRTFYRYLKEKGLPTRREVMKNPSLNPLTRMLIQQSDIEAEYSPKE